LHAAPPPVKVADLAAGSASAAAQLQPVKALLATPVEGEPADLKRGASAAVRARPRRFPRPRLTAVALGFGRINASEIEAPILLLNLV
jgi:hypothetical protein